jgi:DNA-binding CsgD family transcriptional regulator
MSLSAATLPENLAGHRHASVMLLIADPDEVAGIGAAALRQMHGFTAAEARLTLQLLLGRDLPTAATALGISVHTAKTLLKRAFIRTGTNRQSELVGKILHGLLGAIRVCG